MHKKKVVLSIPKLLFILIAILPVVYMYLTVIFSSGLLNKLILNERQITLLYKSLAIGFWTGFFASLIGLILAFLITHTDIPGKNIFKILFIIPLLIPLYIIALAWINIGDFNMLKPLFDINSVKGVVLVLTLGLFPIVFFIVSSSLDSIEPELEETGYIIAGKPETIKKITFPLIIPAIIVSFILVFILAVSNFSVPAALQINTYPVEIFSQISAFNSFEDAIIISLPLLMLISTLIIGLRILILKKPYVSVFGKNRQRILIKLKKWKYLWFSFCLGIVFLSLLLPIGILLKKSFNLEAYAFALKTSYHELIRSLIFSIIGASLIVIFSFFISYAGRNKVSLISGNNLIKQGHLTGNGYILLFALPSTLLGAAFVNFWNKSIFSFLYKGPFIIIFLYMAGFLPVGIEIVSVALNQFDKSLEEAGQSLGVSWGKIITGIVLPILKPSFIIAWIISFILCFGELGGSLMVAPAGMATLPMRMYNLMHYESSSLTAALAIITLIVMFIPIVILFRIGFEKRESE